MSYLFLALHYAVLRTVQMLSLTSFFREPYYVVVTIISVYEGKKYKGKKKQTNQKTPLWRVDSTDHGAGDRMR